MAGNHLALSRDARRLLYGIAQYTSSEDGLWMKEFNAGVLVHVGVKAGVFNRYTLAPSLFSFRGVKMFAMVSQEALVDIETFFRASLVERMLLNTQYYAPIRAIRISSTGKAFLEDPEHVSEEDRAAADRLIRCEACGGLVDFAVSRETEPNVKLVMNEVCNCKTRGAHRGKHFLEGLRPWQYKPIDTFFGIGSVAYAGRAYYLGGAS